MTTNTVTKILDLLQAIQTIHPEFPIQYAVCLLKISQNEGQSLTDLAQQVKIPLSTLSRIIGALSDNRKSGKAYDLVSVKVSKTERRRKELYLTTRGSQIIHDLENIMHKDNDQRLRA